VAIQEGTPLSPALTSGELVYPDSGRSEGGRWPSRRVRNYPDTFRTASLLIDQCGENAPLRSAERTDQLLDAGDMIGAKTWRRILEGIEEFRRGRNLGEPMN
jgi:hypothetical protein